jgi:tRNA pseudouridine38-40 synthase
MRIALGIEYDGIRYQGWQLQRDANTVQAVVEAAISRVADHAVRLHCGGRTDAGVHATGQVAHFDTVARRDARGWILGANVNLPADINVTWARVVADGFHARFSATRRRYDYLIFNRLARSAVLAGRAAWVHAPLDVERMAEGGAWLVGRHDFSSFRARDCQARSPVRTVHELKVRRRGDLVVLTVEADGFLQRMVRNIAGVLIDIGRGRRPPLWAKSVLEQREREQGGATAPACGLYLTGISYPEEFGIPTAPPLVDLLSGTGRERERDPRA